MSAIGSRNAMFVLRMVLDHRPAWAPFRAYSAPNEALFSFTSKRASVDAPPTPTNFLDDDVDEYENIKPSLPPRDMSHHSLPWPTVFASEAAIAQQNERRMCDTLYRLVSRQDYTTARSILDELDQHGVPVWPQDIYLKPALHCLQTGDKDGFFRWFRLISARPLTLAGREGADDPGLFQPILNHISTTYKSDIDFIRQVLLDAGKLGVLPTILQPVVAHLTTVATPSKSLPALKDALEAYRSTVVPESTSSIPSWQEEAVGDMMEEAWNFYLRRLLFAGHVKEAKILYRTMKDFNSEIKWTAHTRQVYLRMLDRKVRPEKMIPLDQSLTLDERIAMALNSGTRAQDVSKIISALLLMKEYDRLADFEKAFAGLDGKRQRIWTLAEMISLRERGQSGSWQLHVNAINKFTSRYVWYGLPPLPDNIEVHDTVSDIGKKQPTIGQVNAIISSIQAITPISSASFHAWHKQYLDLVPSLPPSLQPDAYTHKTVIRGFIRYLGSVPAQQAISNIVKAGLHPGQGAIEELLYSYVRQGKSNRLVELIQAMESRETRFGMELSPPTEAAYAKVQRLLEIRMPPERQEQVEDDSRETAKG